MSTPFLPQLQAENTSYKLSFPAVIVLRLQLFEQYRLKKLKGAYRGHRFRTEAEISSATFPFAQNRFDIANRCRIAFERVRDSLKHCPNSPGKGS
jgi:hypothetical protein